MPTILDDLVPGDDLAERVNSGHVRIREHPTAPLRIANYTSKATFEGVWDHVTRLTRGLIWNHHTREVVARPFPKFFALHENTKMPPQSPPIAHEKLDGSLGILYPWDGVWAVATRGSLDSDQARWATDRLRSCWPELKVPDGLTPLVEILYPQNRIVVDHGREELCLLGAIDIATGADVPLWEIDWWPGPVAGQHVVASAEDGYRLATGETFAEAEGLVLTWYRPGRPSFRAKVKHPRYVHLHRIITNTTERDVWRSVVATDWRNRVDDGTLGSVLNISAGTAATLPTLAEMLDAVPPTFAAAVRTTEERLRAAHAVVREQVDRLWAARPTARPDGDRRAFALWANASEHRHLLFERLDCRPWQLAAWASCRPPATPVGATTDGHS